MTVTAFPDEAIRRYKGGDAISAIAADLGITKHRLYQLASRHRVRRYDPDRRIGCRQLAMSMAADILSATGIDILDRTRKTVVVRHRHAAMLALRHAGYSYPLIAWSLGLHDHTSIMHGVDKAKADDTLHAMAVRIAARVPLERPPEMARPARSGASGASRRSPQGPTRERHSQGKRTMPTMTGDGGERKAEPTFARTRAVARDLAEHPDLRAADRATARWIAAAPALTVAHAWTIARLAGKTSGGAA